MGIFDKLKSNNKKNDKNQINDSAFGGFLVSKNVIAGKTIRYNYREGSTIPELNGWNIYSIDDNDEYVSNPDNFIIIGENSINAITPIMLAIYNAPYGTDLCWIYNKKGKHIGFYDLVKNEDTTLEKILNAAHNKE